MPIDSYRQFLTAAARGPAAERALARLDGLYQPEDIVELRAVSPTRGAISLNGRLTADRERLLAFIREHNGLRNLYFGINPRSARLAGTGRSATKDDVATRRHVVLDLDNKDAPRSGSGADPDWLRTRQAFSLAGPRMLVSSGNGWHIWLPVEAVAGADLDASVAPLAVAMASLGADNMADLPRIIRLPETINIPTKSKRERASGPARLALARVVHGPDQTASVRDIASVASLIAETASNLGLPGRKTSGAAAAAGAQSAPSAEELQAPSAELLEAAVALLPNTDQMDRDFQLRVAHAVRGRPLKPPSSNLRDGPFLIGLPDGR